MMICITYQIYEKFINFTAHNDARDGSGALVIEIVEPWYTDHQTIKTQFRRTFVIDSEEKFIALYNALAQMKIKEGWT